jgi:hypothetical protein
MRQSLLLQVIEKLDKKDLREARKWLLSPIHNSRPEVVELFDYVTSQLQKSPDLLTKELIFGHIYKDKTFVEAQVNHLMSWLLDALRAYLGWREWQLDQPSVHLQHCRAMRQLGLDQAFEKASEQAHQILEAQPFRDEQYFSMRHLLQRERQEHASLQRRTIDISLDEMAYFTNTASRLNQLRLECSQVAMRNFSKNTKNTTNIEEQPQERYSSAVITYENLLKALNDPSDEQAFFTTRDLLTLHWNLFRGNERRDLYLLALNYCIRKINEGQRHFMREAFELYRVGLENRALFEYGQVSRFTYKNTITAGLNLGEFDWVRTFIETYRIHLHPREQHSAYSYNLAVWCFWTHDHDQAMTLLRETDFADPLTNLDARSILLKVYYEKGYHDVLESHLDSFLTYLRRQNSIGYQRENYQNLIKITRKMLREGSVKKLEETKKQALRDEIIATKALAERGWLLSQLD